MLSHETELKEFKLRPLPPHQQQFVRQAPSTSVFNKIQNSFLNLNSNKLSKHVAFLSEPGWEFTKLPTQILNIFLALGLKILRL